MEQILAKLVEFPTVIGNREANSEALAYVDDFLRRRGMHVKQFVFNGHGTLIATSRATKTPEIMLAAHIDVVTAPQHMFSLRKVNDKYVGRGVLDMKCAIAAYLQVVEELKDDLANYNFGIMITSDEEGGSNDGTTGTKHLLDAGFVPKAAVLPDGGQDWQLETTSNGYMHLTLEARGKAGHSSRPWLNDSATSKLVGLLHELQAQFKTQGPDTDMLNIAVLKSDAPANQTPDYASAEISLRLKHIDSLAYWRKVINELCDKYHVTAATRMAWGAFHNDIENPYIRAYADITESVTGVHVAGFHSYGSSDARFFAQRGIPYANAYPRGGGHHGNDEWLAVEALPQLKEIIRKYLKQTARLPLKTDWQNS